MNDYIEITEQDIRDDASRQGCDPNGEMTDAFVETWKHGMIYACGRTREGFLQWKAMPERVM